ncbi:hypothetical protein F4803DRAFT_556496 [Xylaria telfairii]|nr:hypothetical protein F4803DRAFT_556496 [Xylaria telfairii]
MSQQQQKEEGNGDPVIGDDDGVSNIEEIHNTHSSDLDASTADKTQASDDANQVAEVLTAAEGFGHGTENEEESRALVVFIAQSATNMLVPIVATTTPPAESSQPVNAESITDYHTGNSYGYQQYNVPPSQAANNVYGTTVTFARLSDDDFKALNFGMFNFHAPRNQIMDGSRIVSAIVKGTTVLIHARVLKRSRVLYETYNNGSESAINNQAVFPEIGLPEFKILMLAMYGVNNHILGHRDYAGVDYVKALSLSNTFRCQPEVYDSITECARGHFSALQNWGAIPCNGLTWHLHRQHMRDINSAFKLYQDHFRGDGPVAFSHNSFAVLLWELCPARVYCMYSDTLDPGLVRQVSNAALRHRENIHPFSFLETKLFTSPGY